ncbi:hypothetical protein Tco_1498138 [Tanacetum coccineum]
MYLFKTTRLVVVLISCAIDPYSNALGYSTFCCVLRFEGVTLESFKIIAKGKVFMEEQSHVSEEEEGEFNTSDVEGVAEMIFGDNSASSKKHNEEVNEQHSEDPFELYELLKQKKTEEAIRNQSPSLSHPPGFTPVGSEAVNIRDHVFGAEIANMDKEVSPMISAKVMNFSQAVQEEVSCNSARQSEAKNGGSVLVVLDEVIRVGQAIGYSMEGCEKDVESIIRTQGEDVVFR